MNILTKSFIFKNILIIHYSIAIDYSCTHANNWKLNQNSQFNTIFNSNTDITLSHIDESHQNWHVTSTGIVSYDMVFTEAMIKELNDRPKYGDDFFNREGVSSFLLKYFTTEPLSY